MFDKDLLKDEFMGSVKLGSVHKLFFGAEIKRIEERLSARLIDKGVIGELFFTLQLQGEFAETGYTVDGSDITDRTEAHTEDTGETAEPRAFGGSSADANYQLGTMRIGVVKGSGLAAMDKGKSSDP